MSRYCLPANARDMTALELIRFEQVSTLAMVRPLPRPTMAAVALASWLLADHRRAQVQSRRQSSPLSMGSTISRLLAREIIPSDQLAEALARMTAGAVKPDDWNWTYRNKAEAGDTADDDPGRAFASGEAMLSASPHPRSTAMGAEDVAGALPIPQPGAPVTMGIDLASPDGDMTCVAVLGETPPGPLFRVIPPTRRHPFYEVHGLALSFRVGESGARALYTALGTAIGVAPGSPA